MPKFTIRDILLSTSLIATMLLGGLRLNSVAATWSWLLAWPILGAGLFLPFKQVGGGAVLGTLLMLAILLARVL